MIFGTALKGAAWTCGRDFKCMPATAYFAKCDSVKVFQYFSQDLVFLGMESVTGFVYGFIVIGNRLAKLLFFVLPNLHFIKNF